MTRRAPKPWRPPVRRLRIFWPSLWQWVDLREDEIHDIVEQYPGVLKIEDMQGNVVWRPN